MFVKIMYVYSLYISSVRKHTDMYVINCFMNFQQLLFLVFFSCIYSEYKMIIIEMKNCVLFLNGL